MWESIWRLFFSTADKHKAKRHQWRVPEPTLLLAAFLGGCIGAMAGMALFHHKTRKTKFRVGVPAAVVLWAVILIFGGLPFCLLALDLRRSGKCGKIYEIVKKGIFAAGIIVPLRKCRLFTERGFVCSRDTRGEGRPAAVPGDGNGKTDCCAGRCLW